MILLLMIMLNFAAFEFPIETTADDEVMQRFMMHLESYEPDTRLAKGSLIRGLRESDSAAPAAEFIPAALSILDPDFAMALRAFDDHNAADAARLFSELRDRGDPFIAANASYFHARALLDADLAEEAETLLEAITSDPGRLREFTPFASHAFFLLGVTRAENLRYRDAADALRQIGQDFAEAPEAVRIGARQLSLELDRRELGTLGEVSDYMGYIARRLGAQDREERITKRGDETVALLDKLIDQAKQREQQQKRSRSSSRRGSKTPQGAPPMDGRDVSEAPEGGGKVGDLHGVEKADPGAAWGKLPPSERERILQSLRQRFPSRYRELVEQYYRSLAEEK